ncbi:MAG: hypothetical protein D6712_16850 [Chloroflexi bacterium]|nr:MAG: hypothetical protein D6712_16850 [Chloroflexota bacterium]
MATASELQQQGEKLFHQHDYEAAAQVFQQALEAYEADGLHDKATEMRVNIALIHRSLGEYDQALDLMQQALKFFQEQGDAKRAAMVLGNLGGLYAAMGDKEQAYNAYRQAADTFEELGEEKLYGETLVAMGDLQVREGKLTSGAATYQVGLEHLGDLNMRQKIIRRLSGLINRFGGGS